MASSAVFDPAAYQIEPAKVQSQILKVDLAKATPEEILGGLDAAHHERALVFAMHEPDGYSAANDAVLAAAAASGGRLQALASARSCA